MKRVLLLFFFCILTAGSSAQALSWAISFVVWKGHVYEVTDEPVESKDLGKIIGEVKRMADDMTGEYFGDASNMYPKGTKYYEIKGISTKSAIAVEAEKDQWLKAVYAHKAPFHWMDVVTKVLPFLILIGLAITVLGKTKKARR